MTNYRVMILHDACTTHDVTAENEAGAIDAAMNEVSVCLCHQCSNEIELADPIRVVMVENLDTGESNDDADPDSTVVALRKDVEQLRRMLAVRVAGSALYSDDGELNDCRTLPYIDFKRDTVQAIEDKLNARGLTALAAAERDAP